MDDPTARIERASAAAEMESAVTAVAAKPMDFKFIFLTPIYGLTIPCPLNQVLVGAGDSELTLLLQFRDGARALADQNRVVM